MSLYRTNFFAARQFPLVAVSPSGLAWVDGSPGGRLQWQPVDSSGIAASTALAQLWQKAVLDKQVASSSDLLVCLSGNIAQHWLQPVPEQTASLAELHAVAQARAHSLFGASTDSVWRISGQWDSVRPFVCTAVSSAWDPLWVAMRASHKRLRFVTSYSLALEVVSSRFPVNGWLAVLTEERVFITHRQGGTAATLRSTLLPAFTHSDDAQNFVMQEWRREKIRYPEGEGLLHGLSLNPKVSLRAVASDFVPITLPRAALPSGWATAHTPEQAVGANALHACRMVLTQGQP